MYFLHPSKKLIELYSNKPYQGAAPEDAEFLFIGLDANFAPEIEDTKIFPVVEEYLKNGVAFWHKYGVHHPFRLPEYRGDGNRYHNLFEQIGFKPSHAAKVSFIEMIEVPTIGVSKLVKEDLNSGHMDYLNRLITSGKNSYVFIPNTVAQLMRATKRFSWLKSKPQSSFKNILVWAKMGQTVVLKTYHLSYRYDPAGMKKQVKAIGALL